MKQNIFNAIVIFIIGFMIGLMILTPSCSKSTDPPEIVYINKYDTVTIEKERILNHTKIKYISTIDTFYTIMSDTVLDTVYVQELPIEHKLYSDTIKKDSIETLVSINYHGFMSEIDSVSLIHKYDKQINTITLQPKKVSTGFFIGPSVGYSAGISPTGLFVHGPTINFSVGWGLTIRK